jgi:hypothetical protein
MPRARGKANYKVELLIDVVEEKLPQGALGWQEVAALYQFRSQESVLRDYEDVKRHWTEKLYNKFKKPTGDPGDPVLLFTLLLYLLQLLQQLQELLHLLLESLPLLLTLSSKT